MDVPVHSLGTWADEPTMFQVAGAFATHQWFAPDGGWGGDPTLITVQGVPDLTQNITCNPLPGPSAFEVSTAAGMTNLLLFAGDVALVHADGTKLALHTALQNGNACGDDLGLGSDQLAQATHAVTGTGRQIGVLSGTVETGDDLNALWGLILSELESGRPLLLHAQNNPDLAHAGASHAVTVVGLAAGEGPPRILVHDSAPTSPPGELSLLVENLSGAVTVVTMY